MKRLLLFLLLAGAGAAALVHWGGGLEGPLRSRPQPVVEETPAPRGERPRIETGQGTPDIDALEGITQPAPPRRIVWRDRLSDERIEIPTFIPWRFRAKDAHPLQTPSTEQQGVLAHAVSFHLYREPRTRAEALALLRNEEGAYDALLHQRFTANEARVFGHLGEALSRRRPQRPQRRGLGDTWLRLTGNVLIHDESQGLEVRGNDLTVWPEQDRAEGDGHFTLEHEALVLKGERLVMEREAAKGWSRVSIERNPVLRIVAEGRDKNGKPIFDFGEGEFRPATISSSGRAILVRQASRSDTVITVTFSDDVNAVQEGGRTLTAGRAELVVARSGRPGARRESSWKLQHFHAGKGVKLLYPGRTSAGAKYLTSVTADRMIHDVPIEGSPATVLEGDVLILLRGEIPILGPDGRLRLMCRDRAWIGPLPAGAPSGGLDRATLQQIGLRGNARIERETVGPARAQDVLEADAIDLIVQPQERETRPAALGMQARMLAIHFAALGNVIVGGTRIRGATHRLIGDELHTEHPRLTAEGKGTRFEFTDLGGDQRLLGPDRETTPAAGDTPAEEDKPKGRWALQRLLARGAVDVSTSVGGPALGIPAHLTGDELSYDRVSRRARLVAAGAALARIAWSASRSQTNEVATRELTLDRSGGRITARGGVRGTLYVAPGEGGRTGFRMPAARRAGRGLAGAVLAVRTDHRIDIDMLRGGTSFDPAPGKEQVIRIAGPVTTELRAADNSVDRMSSNSLEVALVFLPPPEAPAGEPTPPTARAGRRGAERPAPAAPQPEKLDQVDVQAGAARIDMVAGEVVFLEATGGVDLENAGGRVRGDRVTYDKRSEQIDVIGPAAKPATAFLGASDQRSEVQAERLRLQVADGRAARLEAHAPAGRTSAVHLYRDVRSKPGQVEWFAVTYQGSVVITDDLLQAGRVLVVRRIRQPGRTTWGEPAVLRSPSLRVIGRRLLTTEEKEREILRIVAEGAQGGAEDVHFSSGPEKDLLQIWAHRFDFDVVKREAQLTGLPGRDVTMQRGDGLHSWYTRVTVDMKTNLPSAEGSRILWRPRETKKTEKKKNK